MDSHDINYQAWAVYENLNAFTAAALWCNRNPYIYDKWSDLEFIEVRNLIINLIAHRLRAENYPEDKLKIVAIELGRQFDKGRFECAEEAMKFVISRDQLKATAEKVGVRPAFLYFNSIQIDDTRDNNATQFDNEADKGRCDKQIELMCSTAIRLGYELLKIPEGGKAAIKIECLKNTSLFTDDGFKKAWVEAGRRNQIKIQNKEKYH